MGKKVVAMMLRLPADLHTKLVREAGERTVKTGERVSFNQLVVDVLQRHVERRG